MLQLYVVGNKIDANEVRLYNFISSRARQLNCDYAIIVARICSICHGYQVSAEIPCCSWYRIILHPSPSATGCKRVKEVTAGPDEVMGIMSSILARNPTIRRWIVIRGMYIYRRGCQGLRKGRERDHWLPLSTFWYKMAAPYGAPPRNLSRFKLTHAELAGGPTGPGPRGACAAV